MRLLAAAIAASTVLTLPAAAQERSKSIEAHVDAAQVLDGQPHKFCAVLYVFSRQGEPRAHMDH